MKQSTMEILCCPLCKGELKLQIETKSSKNITEGSIVCSNCKNEYLIRGGIPRMHIPDNEIITLANSSKFSEFIVTPEKLDKLIRRSKTRKSLFFTSKTLTKFLVGFGWILLFFGILTLILSYFNFNVTITNEVSLLVIYLSVMFFIIDYLRYRTAAKIEYLSNLHILKKLSDEQKLSEYDIRTFAKDEDREEDFKNDFESQKNFHAYKGEKIALILNNYNFNGKSALNIGCGGSFHKSVSKPYFDKGYDMIDVDISEEYLKQFNQIFNTEVILADSMALPFKSNKCDLINFTDIIEHLHHPFLGLSEAQRVLKPGGIIILTTENRCRVSFRCINPLVFSEKVISLYYDSILPPRKILFHWLDLDFYHIEFSKSEITELIKTAGFKILSFETQFFREDMLSEKLLNKIFKKFPVLRFMCREFIIIAKKQL